MRQILCALIFCACQPAPPNLPTATVTRGEFLVTHYESGEIKSAGGEIVQSPRIGGRLKIVHLFPEGKKVEVGDLLLQFDPAEFEREMLDREGQLEQAQSDFAKAKAQRQQRLADIKRTIQRQEAQHQLAVLHQERTKFASSIDQEQGQINLQSAVRAMAVARQESTAQEEVNRVDLDNYDGRIRRRQERYDRARRNYERTSLYANKPGIVVYRKIWKRGSDEESKVTVGDQVWSGTPLLHIPDLDNMQVHCLIGEMDIERIRVGQRAHIRLEAFPGPVFSGVLTDLAPMASPQPGAPDIRVFDLVIDIDEQDDRLKPGMSAEVEIVLEAVPDVLSIPLTALFYREDGYVVLRFADGEFAEMAVELGQKNAIAAVVTSGLAEGDIIALPAPTAP
ncbi:MAG: efflux RND transporter periplasmic adaptor subunit [Candidatus Latescibacterota bacterium]|nr:efflux RND transporter periplasmic adaptor subunit [Candidatus Latescibacterota bacterium]